MCTDATHKLWDVWDSFSTLCMYVQCMSVVETLDSALHVLIRDAM